MQPLSMPQGTQSIPKGGRVMAAKLGVHEGVIRPSLVQELEQYRARTVG